MEKQVRAVKGPATGNWRSQFFKTVPVRDEHGNPITSPPALNTQGFWTKPEHKRFDRPGEKGNSSKR